MSVARKTIIHLDCFYLDKHDNNIDLFIYFFPFIYEFCVQISIFFSLPMNAVQLHFEISGNSKYHDRFLAIKK